MAWTKSKIVMVAVAGLLLVSGTAAIILLHEGKSMRSLRTEWSVIRGDQSQWSFAGGKIMAHSFGGETILASRNQYGDVTFSAVAGSLRFLLSRRSSGHAIGRARGAAGTDH